MDVPAQRPVRRVPGQRIQAELIALDRRAAAAVEAELAETTVAELVGTTGSSTLAVAGGAASRD